MLQVLYLKIFYFDIISDAYLDDSEELDSGSFYLSSLLRRFFLMYTGTGYRYKFFE